MEYKGDLKGFPAEIVEKMLERQEEQGNKRNINVFQRNIKAIQANKGFDWTATPEKYTFWHKVTNREFEKFFEKYPKDKPEYPCVMLVWRHDESTALKRVVFMEKAGRYLAWIEAETLEEAKTSLAISPWENAKPLPKQINMTVPEIEKALKITNLNVVQ